MFDPILNFSKYDLNGVCETHAKHTIYDFKTFDQKKKNDFKTLSLEFINHSFVFFS